MGLYFRKSVRLGPFRVNFSKSGIGLSAGIPGLRIGTGPRGNYIQMGSHGLYYRATLPRASNISPASKRQHLPPPPRSTEHDWSEIPPSFATDFEAIESVPVEQLADSSSEALLTEIRRKHARLRSWPAMAVLLCVYFVICLANSWPGWAWAAGAVAGLIGLVCSYRFDVMRKLVVLHYEVDGRPAQLFGALVEAVKTVASAPRLWHISGSAKVADTKYHAGAGSAVLRNAAAIDSSQPPYMASNLDPVTVKLSKSILYLFPDRMLMYRDGKVGAISYRELRSETSRTRFVEEEGVPSNANIVGRTWKFVNKGGGPDRRFKNNRELPICSYGQLELVSSSGLHELLMISLEGPEIALSKALHELSLL